MDVTKILAELKSEREQIEKAILSLEQLAHGRVRKRGRPPNWMSELAVPKRRGRPPGSKNKVHAADLTVSGAGATSPADSLSSCNRHANRLPCPSAQGAWKSLAGADPQRVAVPGVLELEPQNCCGASPSFTRIF